MKIRSVEHYGKAIERYHALVSAGETVESSVELADLEAALHAYGLPSDQPASSAGRPASDPYDLESPEKKNIATH